MIYLLICSVEGRVLGDDEHLSQVLKDSTHYLKLHCAHASIARPIQEVRHRVPPTSNPAANSLIRVYHNSERGIQTFQSMIVTSSTTSSQVLENVLPGMAPSGRARDYAIVLVTPDRGKCLFL